ncbi:PspC domain-containing protein [Bacteroidota bacterium]
MKKTIKININGIVFNVDEDAFDKLSKYLKSLEGHFSHSDEGKEIISDIEARIAELFQECLSPGKEVINITDVTKVLEILGQPEEFDDDDETSGQKESFKESLFSIKGKRLYRDTDNRVLGGVCSGIAEYFNIDPVIVRIVIGLTFLFYLTGLLIYAILWIAIPAADTTAKKLEMKGEKVNVPNIEKKIREEYEHVKDNLKKIPSTEYYRRSRSFFERFFGGIGRIILVFFKIILAIIGVCFVIAGFSVLVGLFGGFFFSSETFNGHLWGFDSFTLNSFLYKFADPSNVSLAMTGIALFIGIPVVAIIYAGIKMLFRFRANNRIIGASAFTFWLVGLGLLIFVGIDEGKHFSAYSQASENVQIEQVNSNTLYLELSENIRIKGKTYDNYDSEFFGFDDFRIISKDEGDLFLGKANFTIEQSDTDNIYIKLKKKSYGLSQDMAQNNASTTEYKISQTDSLFVFDPYFVIPKNKKWRGQELRVIMYIPVGMEIYISESMEEILSYIYTLDNNYQRYIGGKTWIMKDGGLSLKKDLPE